MINLGRKSLDELRNTDKDKVTFTEVIEYLLSLSSIEQYIGSALTIKKTAKQMQVIKARYGYEDGKKKTLDQVGKTLGVTRERVRQILVNSHKRLQHPLRNKYIQKILEHIEYSLLQNKGVVSVGDLSTDTFFYSSSNNQLRFLLNLIADLYEERYRIIEESFFTSLNDEELKELNVTIDEASFKCHFPIDKNDYYKEIISSIGNISKDYLVYFLIHKKHIEISDGLVLTPGKLSIPHKIKLIMKDIANPMHFTDIAKLFKEYYGEKNIRTSDIERAIHTRIGDSKDFIIVGLGTYMLRDKLNMPDNINEIVEISTEILRSLNNISDTKYLIEKIKKKGINVGTLNAYSLKPILLDHPGFVSYRKFEIGLEELTDKYERKPLSNLMYDILLAAGKPLHAKEIWKQISKHRGFSRYTIEQRLYKDSQFIKIAPTTYTIKENIPSYEIKYESIVNFAKEWINLKGHAVSAFFVNEVLKATEEIMDLSIGLVEHILSTSPEFIKLPNRFYELTNKS